MTSHRSTTVRPRRLLAALAAVAVASLCLTACAASAGSPDAETEPLPNGGTAIVAAALTVCSWPGR
mgnify:CR=1 FL=1